MVVGFGGTGEVKSLDVGRGQGFEVGVVAGRVGRVEASKSKADKLVEGVFLVKGLCYSCGRYVGSDVMEEASGSV